jgi:23S rRNA pseudouridine1911/1915/1917 synthase
VKHSVEREYLALVHGEAESARYETDFIANRGDGLRGSWGVFRRPRGPLPSSAKHAITDVSVVRRLKGATLVACRLETGRQHQIRIHLSEAGHPLIGERVYIREYTGPRIDADRPMLHAGKLGFTHPVNHQKLTFEQPIPEDFAMILQKLEL